MKKLAIMALGLGLALGSVATTFAKDDTNDTTKKKKKKKKADTGTDQKK